MIFEIILAVKTHLLPFALYKIVFILNALQWKPLGMMDTTYLSKIPVDA
jgi:hypothetical protein